MLMREVIGDPACPMIYRWTLVKTRRFGRLMVHRFLPGGDDRHDHDHPAGFVTLVLAGGYDDLVPCGWCNGAGLRRIEAGWPRGRIIELSCTSCEGSRFKVGERMRRGMVRRRSARFRHRTRALPSGAWTIVWMFPHSRPWGFWVDGRWVRWREYHERFGFGMRCPDA